MGETRVDLHHLLEDLRDAYPGALEETILTEVVANALDSGATCLRLTADPASATLTILDDGSGMRRRDLVRYHDLAASTKTRGHGIGFAGVGIKLGLLVCEDVVTETKRGKEHVASLWHLAGRHKAPWKWMSPLGLVADHGTAVSRIAVCPARRRKPTAVGYLARSETPLPDDQRGLAISTFGKVIKRGWDWLGITSAASDRIAGMIEAPELAAALTLNKGDFVRVGARGALYLGYRKAIQEAVSRQLAQWGDAPASGNQAGRRAMRPLERDLETVLVDLAEEFPLLSSLVEQRAGGQKRLPIGRTSGSLDDGQGFLTASVMSGADALDEAVAPPEAPPETAGGPLPAEEEPGTPPPQPESPPGVAVVPGPKGRSRPTHYGLSIRFESREGDPDLGRLLESTVVINDAHPAYRRAAASRSEGYHIALAVALALARLAVPPAEEHEFVTAFLTHWGEALDRPRRRPRR